MTSVCGFQRRRREFFRQQLGRVFFHHDAAFEIESGGESEIFVRWPGVTINAAVLAAAIGIDARFETDIGAVVMCDDRPGEIAVVNGAAGWPFRVVFVLRIRLYVERLKAVGRIPGSASSVDRFGLRYWFVRTPHLTRSTERMQCPVWILNLSSRGWRSAPSRNGCEATAGLSNLTNPARCLSGR